jgi:hypothetical protein
MNAGKTSERALAVEIQRLGTVTLEGVDWDVNQPAYHGKFRPEGRQALPGHVPLRVVIGDDFRIEWKVADACAGSPAWPDPRSAVARAFPDEAVRRMIELLGELTERADQELASEVVRYAAIHEINHLKNAPIKLGISIEINRRLIESLPNVRMERADRERIEAETRADLERHEVELRNIEERRTERMATLVQINEAIIEWQFARFDRSKPRRPFMEIYEKATERRPLPAPR